ncbi:hypothetical protein DSO57_1036982 [Entomophthora muscae]|uniref:Uncharacterized protein n=1 Tax=Entomophthora muscae TaxID=34485 RepID=A0ACC2TX75_9FUNG|nr:hypothetical protein DSO57_1036982 [Entomophthora muscae]
MRQEFSYPHMLAGPQQFSRVHGIVKCFANDLLLYTMPTESFLLADLGHKKVSLLNGGLARWKAEGFPVTTAPECSDLAKSSYSASEFDKNMVASCSCAASVAASAEPRAAICDARSNEKFNGKAPEPQKGLSIGSSSDSITFDQVLKDGDASHSFKIFKSPEELKEFFIQAGLCHLQPIVTTCGTGVTACILEFFFAIWPILS